MYHDMGVLSSSDLIQYRGRDLVCDTVCETASKIQRKLTSFIGRAVLIRDADYICDHTAAVHEICHFPRKKSNQGKMLLILSGLKADMKWLMSIWPILLALFDEKIDFENIPPQDCIALLLRELGTLKVIPEAGFLKAKSSNEFQRVNRLFNVIQKLPVWCNALDIRQLVRQILGLLLKACASTTTTDGLPEKSLPQLSVDMVIQSITRRITQRRDEYVLQVSSRNDGVLSLLSPPMASGSPSAQAVIPPAQQRLQIALGRDTDTKHRSPQVGEGLSTRDERSTISGQHAIQTRHTPSFGPRAKEVRK
jgi:hypothetical protein